MGKYIFKYVSKGSDISTTGRQENRLGWIDGVYAWGWLLVVFYLQRCWFAIAGVEVGLASQAFSL